MKALLDHDPLSGRSVIFEYHAHDDTMTITHHQNVDPYLKMAEERRHSAEYTKHGMDRDLLHYAILPEVVQVEMRDKYGVDVNNRNHWPAVFRLINEVYPRFKTTEMKHSIRG